MRIDKFLKVSRLIKRRTIAKQFCDQGRIVVNGKTVGAGQKVAVGDQITIRYGQKEVVVQVEKLTETVRKDEAESLFRWLQDIPIDTR